MRRLFCLSADVAPVDAGFEEALHLAGEGAVFFFLEQRIGLEDGGGGLYGFVEYESVFPEVGDAEVAGEAALLGSLDVAGAAEFEVDFGDFETVVGGGHGFHAFAGFVGEFVGSHEDTVGLFGSPADTATQLVELGEPEAFGALDDHDGGVGDVDADLDDGGGDEYLGFAGGEAAHLFFFLGGFEFAVDDADGVAQGGEVGADVLVAFLEVAVVHFLGFGDERVDDVCLAAFLDFLADEFVDLQAPGFVDVVRGDGFTSRGKLVDDGDVEIAVEGHGQGAGDGGGRHDEHVRGNGVFLP